jgi:hypothetical protein
MWFSVSDATAAPDTAQKIGSILIFCAVLDAAVASDTENHGSCKQTFKQLKIFVPYDTFRCCVTPIRIDPIVCRKVSREVVRHKNHLSCKYPFDLFFLRTGLGTRRKNESVKQQKLQK